MAPLYKFKLSVPVASFVIEAAAKAADEVIEHERIIQLSRADAEQIMARGRAELADVPGVRRDQRAEADIRVCRSRRRGQAVVRRRRGRLLWRRLRLRLKQACDCG